MRPMVKVLALLAVVALWVNPGPLITDIQHMMRTHPSGTTKPATTGAASNANGGIGARLPAWDPKFGSNHYSFENANADGAPVRWNPCQRLNIVVNLHDAPASSLTDLHAAIARVDMASGLHLVVSGTTTAQPAKGWGTTAGRASGTWAPVLIAFAPPGTGPLQTPGAAASTLPIFAINDRGQNVYVSGEIIINSEQNGLFAPGFGRGNYRGTLLLHELGHLVGLDHSDDPNQVMYPTLGYAPDLGAGDKAGLKALGAGGCLDVPAPDSTS